MDGLNALYMCCSCAVLKTKSAVFLQRKKRIRTSSCYFNAWTCAANSLGVIITKFYAQGFITSAKENKVGCSNLSSGVHSWMACIALLKYLYSDTLRTQVMSMLIFASTCPGL